MGDGLLNGEVAISVQQLAAWREAQTPHRLIDIREAGELAIAQVENAVHIPMSEIALRLDDVPVDGPVVVMCHHGMRSLRVVQFLRAAGRANAVNLDGGIDAWALQIDRSVPRY